MSTLWLIAFGVEAVSIVAFVALIVTAPPLPTDFTNYQ